MTAKILAKNVPTIDGLKEFLSVYHKLFNGYVDLEYHDKASGVSIAANVDLSELKYELTAKARAAILSEIVKERCLDIYTMTGLKKTPIIENIEVYAVDGDLMERFVKGIVKDPLIVEFERAFDAVRKQGWKILLAYNNGIGLVKGKKTILLNEDGTIVDETEQIKEKEQLILNGHIRALEEAGYTVAKKS